MRAAIYCRVSTSRQEKDGISLDGQADICRQYAEKNGIEIVDTITDRCSRSKEDRPGLEKVDALIRRGLIDAIIVWKGDRLGDSTLGVRLQAKYEAAGLERHYVDEGGLQKDDGFISWIKHGMKLEERKETRGRSARMRNQRAEEGNAAFTGGIAPLGYRAEKQGKRAILIPDPDTVPLVRYIFARYTEGANINHICSELETQTGKPWYGSTVYRILKSTTYIGKHLYGKSRWTFTTDGRSQKGTKNDIADGPVTIPVEPIIDLDVWNKAQERLEANKRRLNLETKRSYLLRSRIRCACGAAVVGTTSRPPYAYYRCRQRNTHNGCNLDMPNFRVDHVDAAVWQWVRTYLLDPDNLARNLHATKIALEGNETTRELQLARDRYIALISEVKSEQERLTRLYIKGRIPESILDKELEEIDHRLATLEQQAAEIDARLNEDAFSDQDIEDMVQFAALVAEGLDDIENDNAAKRDIIDMLRVQAIMDIENGTKVLHLSCVLGDETVSTQSQTSRSAGMRTNTVVLRETVRVAP